MTGGTTDPARMPAALHSLTGLRFMAALLVFAFHVTLFDSPLPPNEPITPFGDQGLAGTLEFLFSKAGYVGVSFFFVLSGFVLTWSWRPGETYRAFWRRRVLKIFPNHLVVFGVAMLLFASAYTPVRAWLPNIFLLHSFSPQADVYVSVNPPAWTLCSELLFYLLFPLLIRPISRIRDDRLWWWAGLLVAGTIGVALVAQYLVPDTPTSPITPISVTQFWFAYIFPPARLFEFLLGMVAARLLMAGRRAPLGTGPAIALLGAGYVAALYLPFVYGLVVATVVPVTVLIMAFASADVRGAWTGMASRPARWLGEVSFGFYICQGVTIFYVRRLFGAEPFSTPVALAVVLALFAVTLLAGWALYTVVERPIMRRWARPRKRESAVPSASPAVVPSPGAG